MAFVQAQAEDARTAEWARTWDGDDEEEVPLLPVHLEAQWIVLSCEPWSVGVPGVSETGIRITFESELHFVIPN